jgi:hypothetical protein
MTLAESNAALLDADCTDLDAIAATLTDRARSIAQFAAISDRPTLTAALTAGDDFMDRLELAQLNASRELECLIKLKRGLLANLDLSSTEEHVVCFG